jgi:hypothetical protein
MRACLQGSGLPQNGLNLALALFFSSENQLFLVKLEDEAISQT